MLDYKVQADKQSMYNTPPCFSIYIVNLVMGWLEKMGGVEGIQKINEEKGKLLYDYFDSSDFYNGAANKEDRSLMNVTFRIHPEELEAKFIKESAQAGLIGLKGHRSVGGCRASIYNAMPIEGVKALVAFMEKFEKENK